MKNGHSKFLKELKRRVIAVCGFEIVAKKDCKALSDVIRMRTGESLSEATIYRLFLHGSNTHTFYLSTMNILCRFVGFASWNEYRQQVSSNEDATGLPGVSAFPDSETSLLDHVIRRGAWEIASDYFDALKAKAQEDVYHVIGWTIYNALLNHPERELEFYKRFAHHPFVRTSFFEFAYDPDHLLPHYNDGFDLYLKGTAQMEKNRRFRDHLFAHSLLIRQSFIKGEQAKVIWRFEKYLFPEMEERAFANITQVIPLARLCEAKWIYLYCMEDHEHLKSFQKWWFDWVEENWNKWTLAEQKAVLYCAVEVAQMTDDEGFFFKKVLRVNKQFIATLFGQNNRPGMKEFLKRTEFNGVRLRKTLRIG